MPQQQQQQQQQLPRKYQESIRGTNNKRNSCIHLPMSGAAADVTPAVS
jgi:hypothetical protein